MLPAPKEPLYIRFCFGDYNRAYRAGFGYYEDRIWPDNCPYEHFFLVYQYGDSVAEVDGQTYPQKPDVVEHYGVRVFWTIGGQRSQFFNKQKQHMLSNFVE